MYCIYFRKFILVVYFCIFFVHFWYYCIHTRSCTCKTTVYLLSTKTLTLAYLYYLCNLVIGQKAPALLKCIGGGNLLTCRALSRCQNERTALVFRERRNREMICTNHPFLNKRMEFKFYLVRAALFCKLRML